MSKTIPGFLAEIGLGVLILFSNLKNLEIFSHIKKIPGCLREIGLGLRTGDLKEVAEANQGGNAGRRWNKPVTW